MILMLTEIMSKLQSLLMVNYNRVREYYGSDTDTLRIFYGR